MENNIIKKGNKATLKNSKLTVYWNKSIQTEIEATDEVRICTYYFGAGTVQTIHTLAETEIEVEYTEEGVVIREGKQIIAKINLNQKLPESEKMRVNKME